MRNTGHEHKSNILQYLTISFILFIYLVWVSSELRTIILISSLNHGNGLAEETDELSKGQKVGDKISNCRGPIGLIFLKKFGFRYTHLGTQNELFLSPLHGIYLQC